MIHVKPTIIRLATAVMLCLLAYTVGTANTALGIIVVTCVYIPVRFIHYGKEGRKAVIFFHLADSVLGMVWLIGCAAVLFYYLYCYIFLAPTDKDGYRDGAGGSALPYDGGGGGSLPFGFGAASPSAGRFSPVLLASCWCSQ